MDPRNSRATLARLVSRLVHDDMGGRVVLFCFPALDRPRESSSHTPPVASSLPRHSISDPRQHNHRSSRQSQRYVRMAISKATAARQNRAVMLGVQISLHYITQLGSTAQLTPRRTHESDQHRIRAIHRIRFAHLADLHADTLSSSPAVASSVSSRTTPRTRCASAPRPPST